MKKKIKVTFFWDNFEYGGMNTFLENLINSTKFQKYNVDLITNESNKGIKSLIENIEHKNFKLITYKSFNIARINNFFIKLIYWGIRPILLIFSLIQTFFILKKNKPEILLAACGGYGNFRTDSLSLISARLLNINVRILSIHHSYSKPVAWKQYLQFFDKIISKCSTHIVFGSNAVKDNIEKKTNILKYNNKFSIIHHGVSFKRTNKNKVNLKKLFYTGKKKLIKIGMLSRIEPNKGHFELIKAFNNLPESIKRKFKVFFVGPVDEFSLKDIKKILYDLKLNNFFKICGYINCDSFKIIQKFDIFISLTKTFEGFGLSIAEALYCKKPVLATKVGAVTEYLNTKNSKLIEVNNIKDITFSIIDFYKNKIKWKKKALIGSKLIKKKFSSEIMSKKYFKLFENLNKMNYFHK